MAAAAGMNDGDTAAAAPAEGGRRQRRGGAMRGVAQMQNCRSCMGALQLPQGRERFIQELRDNFHPERRLSSSRRVEMSLGHLARARAGAGGKQCFTTA